jgi:hypothetical protein
MKAALIAAVAAATMAVGLAAPAHADGVRGDQDTAIYAAELNREGLHATLARAGDLATHICQELYDGVSEHDAVAEGVRNGATPRQAAIAVVGAEYHFCGPDGHGLPDPYARP